VESCPGQKERLRKRTLRSSRGTPQKRKKLPLGQGKERRGSENRARLRIVLNAHLSSDGELASSGKESHTQRKSYCRRRGQVLTLQARQPGAAVCVKSVERSRFREALNLSRTAKEPGGLRDTKRDLSHSSATGGPEGGVLGNAGSYTLSSADVHHIGSRKEVHAGEEQH